ncbi:MAG: YciI family protein [Cyanobacteriota/Melainabacteria group bacterium]
MLLVYSEEKAWTEDERNQCLVDSARLCHELAEKGQYIDASPLHSVTAATSLRIRDGKRSITDGPFAEDHRAARGLLHLDVENLDEAIEIASRIPPAKRHHRDSTDREPFGTSV